MPPGLLLDQAPVAVVGRDTAGIVTHWNAQATRLYGWPAADAVGRPMRDLVPARDDLALAETVAVWSGRGEERRWSFVARRPDGARVPVDATVAPLADPEGALLGFVEVAVEASARHAAEARLVHQALHDALTGLPNRALFLDRLGHLLAGTGRRPRPVAVLFLDLDRFRAINDGFGQAAGDGVLCAVAHRLAACLRRGDTLARFGGDEFAVLLDEVADAAGARQVAERLGAALREPFVVAGSCVVLGASIGIALGTSDRVDADALLHEAVVAVDRAKAQGPGIAVPFAPAMAAPARDRLDLEAALRRAVEHGELEVRYQPEVDLASGRVVGAEALVRWPHPERGLLAPGAFVPLAEEAGLIVPLGAWVLGEACRQARRWTTRPGGRSFVVSVNVAARQLQQPAFVGEVARGLVETGLAPGCLKLEVTERVMVDAQTAMGALARLRTLGVRTALDDFGTGYSSLSYLRQLPLHTVKIDRSFVHGLAEEAGSVAIVRAVTVLAHDLGLDVTAEGVETVAQLTQVRALGCDRAQGYYFARPLTAAHLTTLLASTGGRLAGTTVGAGVHRNAPGQGDDDDARKGAGRWGPLPTGTELADQPG